MTISNRGAVKRLRIEWLLSNCSESSFAYLQPAVSVSVVGLGAVVVAAGGLGVYLVATLRAGDVVVS